MIFNEEEKMLTFVEESNLWLMATQIPTRFFIRFPRSVTTTFTHLDTVSQFGIQA